MMVADEKEISNQNLAGSVSYKKANGSISSCGNGDSSLVGDLCLTHIDAESRCQKDSSDDSSLNKFRAVFKDLMEEATIKLIVDVERRFEENGKEIKERIEEINKSTKTMNEDIRKEIKRLDENVKHLYKTERQEHDVMTKESKPQTRKIRGKIDRAQNRLKHE